MRLIYTSTFFIFLSVGSSVAGNMLLPWPTNQPGFLGFDLSITENGVEIISILPDSPAYESGLSEGDMLVGINGYDLSAENFNEAKLLLQGDAGSKVELLLKRGTRFIKKTITRAQLGLILHK